MKNDAFFDRMKRYEDVSSIVMMPRSPVIIRVDGKNFKRLTQGMKKPFDEAFSTCMLAAARRLASEAQNCRLVYTQSDEISLLLTDFMTLNSDPWFGNQVQKVCSIASALATAQFNYEFARLFPDQYQGGNPPVFDARCYNLPREEVANYFIWRQRDCERNSVSMAARANFSHKELQGMNRTQMMDMLMLQRGINWNDYGSHFKRGMVVTKELVEHGSMTSTVVRSMWVASDAPIFSKDRDFVDRFLRPKEDIV